MSNVQFKNLTYATKKLIGKMQTTVNIRISVKKEIAQVLSIGSESNVVSYEATSGSATFYGKTNIKFLYNDGEGVVSSNYNADFTADVQSQLLTADTKLIFDVVTVDTKVDISANTAMLAILLEITVYGYVTQSTPCLVGGEDIFTKGSQMELLNNVEVLSFPFVVDEELTATQPIDTVLLAESAICVTDYHEGAGSLRLKGDAVVRLTYTSGGKIITDTLPFAFEREVDIADVKCQELQICATARTTKVRLDITDDGVNTTLSVDILCNLQLENATTEVVEIVTDAYGSDCDFSFEREQITTTLTCGSVRCERNFVANLPKDGDKTLQSAVNVSAIVTKCTPNVGYATVDGIVYATALYLGDTESEVLEIPFSQKVDVDYLQTDCNPHARVTVKHFALSENGGLTANVTLCIALTSTRDVTYTVVTSANEIPFDKKLLPAMEICLAHKGETLWELAKNLHLSTEDILSVNSDLTDPLTQDARIVIFNHI